MDLTHTETFHTYFMGDDTIAPQEPITSMSECAAFVGAILKEHGPGIERVTVLRATECGLLDVTADVMERLAEDYAHRRSEAHSLFADYVHDPADDAAREFDMGWAAE